MGSSHLCSILSCLAVAGTKHDSTWLKSLEKEPLGLDYIVYQNDDPEKPHYFEPYANEAGAYLLFIEQFYNCLPQVRTVAQGLGLASHDCAAMELSVSAIFGHH